jgi:hypothetical protein
MVTTTPEAVHLHKIILDWCSPQVARSMLDDMDFYVADITDNESLKQSIKMVREILYSRAEENIMIDKEVEEFNVKESMAEQRGMTKE